MAPVLLHQAPNVKKEHSAFLINLVNPEGSVRLDCLAFDLPLDLIYEDVPEF